MADTFAVVARKNSAILVLGDGVNWGGKAALASRSAVHGAMDYLNTALFGVNRYKRIGLIKSYLNSEKSFEIISFCVYTLQGVPPELLLF